MPGKDGQGREARSQALSMRQTAQLELLALDSRSIEGFAYQPDLVPSHMERALVAHFAALEFREFEFHGFLGKRRVVSFGVRYDFGDSRLHEEPDIPTFLHPLRDLAGTFAGLDPSALRHALVTEYQPGAGIGWHRDRPVFRDVVGISLLSPCRFRLRRKAGTSWQRHVITLAPRSAYLLRGSVREHWQHSIPPQEQLRYSVTFRTLSESEA
jgi:alkylated DNA repair dioxygenase AlkB